MASKTVLPTMRVIGAFVLLFALGACDSSDSSSGSLQITDVVVGSGVVAVAGSSVVVDYEGRLENGSIFDDGTNVSFSLSEVIPGFRDGIVGMREGGSREMVIPPNLAYGEAGIPGVIPGNETLTFDVTLLTVQ